MKVIKLLFLFVIVSGAVSAQNFFKPIPKMKGQRLVAKGIVPDAAGDVSFFALRPIASAFTLYIDGDVQAAAGGGLSYQNITQKAADGRSYVNYAFNIIVGGGGSVTTDATKNDIGKAAIFISALNNTVGLGYGLSRQEEPVTLKKKWKGGIAVVWTINFNN